MKGEVAEVQREIIQSLGGNASRGERDGGGGRGPEAGSKGLQLLLRMLPEPSQAHPASWEGGR